MNDVYEKRSTEEDRILSHLLSPPTIFDKDPRKDVRNVFLHAQDLDQTHSIPQEFFKIQRYEYNERGFMEFAD